jgi:hypothetical protein
MSTLWLFELGDLAFAGHVNEPKFVGFTR